MTRNLSGAALLAASFLAAPVFAQDASTVVAKVNDDSITLGQMIAMKETLAQQMPPGTTDEQLWSMLMDQMVRQTAAAQVRAKDQSPRDAAVIEMDRRAYLAGAYLEAVATPEPSDAELQAAYDKAFGSTTEPKTEYNAAHILVADEATAKSIEEELKGGADFGTLAAEKSTDNSGPNKGDLGWFTPDQMVKPFADAVVALKKGEVSPPVQSQFGWHVIKLIDSRKAEPPKFDEVRDELAMQVRRDRVDAALEKLVADAKVETTPNIDPNLLSKTELLNK